MFYSLINLIHGPVLVYLIHPILISNYSNYQTTLELIPTIHSCIYNHNNSLSTGSPNLIHR